MRSLVCTASGEEMNNQVLFHKLLDSQGFSFKLARTVVITLHVIHMHNIHEAMKTHMLVLTSSSSGMADFWREVPRLQMAVGLGWIVNCLNGHLLSLLKIKILAFP